MNQAQTNRKLSNSFIISGTTNAVKCSMGNAETERHRWMKYWLADFCWRHSIHFATEVTFRNNTRCDFLIKDWKLCLEVLGTETIEKFLKKEYPLNTLPVYAHKPYQARRMLEDLRSLGGEGYEYYHKKVIEENKGGSRP